MGKDQKVFQKMTKSLNAVDLRLTQTVFNMINSNPALKMVPYWLGLLPYELYVLPGMFIALIATVYNKSFQPAQIHLLPLWFAYSLVTFIKQAVKRERPGCAFEEMGKMFLIDFAEATDKPKVSRFTGKPIIDVIELDSMIGTLVMLKEHAQNIDIRRGGRRRKTRKRR
jgi:hypothetical protein